jgi:hypothetical protein
MKIIQNYKPSYKEMFALDIIDPLYFVPMVLSVTTGLSLSNWGFVNYSPSWYLAIVIAPMVLALLYHYWIERLTVNYTLVVGPDEDCIYCTKTTSSKVVIHWIYNLLGHSFFLFLILYFLEPYHPLLNALLFLVWLTIPCLVRTYLKGISLDIIKVTFDKDEAFWGKAQREEFLQKYNCDPDKLQERYSG